MKLSSNAISYTIRNLFKIAFPEKDCTINCDDNIVVTIDEAKFVFWTMSDEENEQLLRGELDMKLVETKFHKNLPLYVNHSATELYEFKNDKLAIHCDLITLPFLLLSRYEETVCKTKDKHTRFPYKNSLAALYQFIDYPIVDVYAMLLREWAQQYFPQIKISPRKSNLIITHDIDILHRFGKTSKNIRTIFAGDLIARHSPKLMIKSWKQYQQYKKNHFLDPYIVSTLKLLEEIPENWNQMFFFKAQKTGEKGCTYNIYDKEIIHLLKSIQLNKKEIGLHGSYDSYDNTACLEQELQRLKELCETKITCQRQHYLRFDAKKSPINWENCGIHDDYTLGYAEREGFRCGTCHPYPIYDLSNDKPLNVIEHPLIAMDTTLILHRKLSMNEAYQKLCILMQNCQAVDGDFILLWHNTSTEREFTKWYQNVLVKVVNGN